MVQNIQFNGDQVASRNGHKPASNGRIPRWTVMVYLAGDNNLTSNCITVLQQLEAVKYKRNVRVLACFDSNTPWPKGSRYLAINGKWNKNNKHLDWEIPMKRTDVAEGLTRFMKWAMAQGPSEHYMLVLYGHG